VPLRFALSPAFPNPFNPVTTIPFETASNARVTLEIFDARGTRVATLVNTTLNACRHTRQWHATDQNGQPVAAGVYLCRYTAQPSDSGPTVTAVEKIMLLKYRPTPGVARHTRRRPHHRAGSSFYKR